mmetsp:Transcript_75302/g.210363  ORF Transcript_75302/g.210363 Transcript_75302/m.210363 type:complete len:1243 (-) Transcript_75302:3325-7053(-)
MVPQLGVEVIGDVLQRHPVLVQLPGLQQEIGVLQVIGPEYVRMERGQQDVVLVKLLLRRQVHATGLGGPAWPTPSLVAAPPAQGRVDERGLVAPPGLFRVRWAVQDGRAPFEGACVLDVDVAGVAEAPLLAVQHLRGLPPLLPLHLELSEAIVPQLVHIRPLNDAQLLGLAWEAEVGVVPEGPRRVQRLPARRVRLLLLVQLPEFARLLLRLVQPAQGRRGQEVQHRVLVGHVVGHGPEMLGPLQVLVRPLLLAFLGLPPAGLLQLVLKLVYRLAEVHLDAVPPALLRVDVPSGLRPVIITAVVAEEELEGLVLLGVGVPGKRGEATVRGFLVLVAADLEASGGDPDLRGLVPLRLDAVLALGPHDRAVVVPGQAHAMGDQPAARPDILRELGPLDPQQALVAPVNVDLHALGNLVVVAPYHAETLGFLDGELQHADVHHLELSSVGVAVILVGVHERERPLSGHEEHARALVLALPPVRARGRAACVWRRAMDVQDEPPRVLAQVAERREPALAQEVVVRPHLHQDALPHAEMGEQFVLVRVPAGVAHGHLQRDRVLLGRALHAVVARGQLAQGLAQQGAAREAGHELVLAEQHLGLASLRAELHVQRHGLRAEAADFGHLDQRVEPLAVSGAAVADPKRLALAREGVLNLEVLQIQLFLVARLWEQIDAALVLRDGMLVSLDQLVFHTNVRRLDVLVELLPQGPDAAVRVLCPALLADHQHGVENARDRPGGAEYMICQQSCLPIRHARQSPLHDGLCDDAARLHRYGRPGRPPVRHEVLADDEPLLGELVPYGVAPLPHAVPHVPSLISTAVVVQGVSAPLHRLWPPHVLASVARPAAPWRTLNVLLLAGLIVHQQRHTRVPLVRRVNCNRVELDLAEPDHQLADLGILVRGHHPLERHPEPADDGPRAADVTRGALGELADLPPNSEVVGLVAPWGMRDEGTQRGDVHLSEQHLVLVLRGPGEYLEVKHAPGDVLRPRGAVEEDPSALHLAAVEPVDDEGGAGRHGRRVVLPDRRMHRAVQVEERYRLLGDGALGAADQREEELVHAEALLRGTVEGVPDLRHEVHPAGPEAPLHLPRPVGQVKRRGLSWGALRGRYAHGDHLAQVLGLRAHALLRPGYPAGHRASEVLPHLGAELAESGRRGPQHAAVLPLRGMLAHQQLRQFGDDPVLHVLGGDAQVAACSAPRGVGIGARHVVPRQPRTAGDWPSQPAGLRQEVVPGILHQRPQHGVLHLELHKV